MKKKPFSKRLVKAIKQPRLLMTYLLVNYLAPFFSDKTYIKIKSFLIFGKSFNIDNPTTFNEKMNWLKLNDRNPNYSNLVDKLKVKEHVANLIGEQYVVPLIATWDNVNEIDFTQLPDICVLKTNQDSGGAIIYQKGISNKKEILKKLNSRMHLFNYYYYSREYPYKEVKKKIFAEEFLDNGKDDKLINDYKFWCFNGEPKIMYITVKSSVIYENFYDMEFNPIYIKHGSERRMPEFSKPKYFEEMKSLAAVLSKNIHFVRVDFFYVNEKIYFGEYTFFDYGGFKPFEENWDEKLGDLLELPLNK
ncbi:MAG: ATP-grasp fold amidoligase family protein [Bacteroidales bacterium]|jgi:hypothetical protein